MNHPWGVGPTNCKVQPCIVVTSVAFLKKHFSQKIPPKSHNLIYLLNEIGIKPPEEPGKFVAKLNEASIPTRYPENLSKLQQVYTEMVVKDILKKGKELATWIKEQL